MARLIYASITSLDGYVVDADGNFDWAEPDDEVHQFVNDLGREIGTYLYGRRMYEVMVYWETVGESPGQSQASKEYAEIWKATHKIVYSTTLTAVSSARTRLEPVFDPAAVRGLKASADKDLTVAGPHLAAEAIKAGLVDEYHLFLTPVLVGGGTRSLPDDIRIGLELVDEHRFAGGTMHLHYRVTR